MGVTVERQWRNTRKYNGGTMGQTMREANGGGQWGKAYGGIMRGSYREETLFFFFLSCTESRLMYT